MKFRYYLSIISFCISCGSYTKVSYPIQEALHKGKVKVELTSGVIQMFDNLDRKGDVYYGYTKNRTIQLREPDFRAIYLERKYEYVYRVNVKLISATLDEAVNKGSIVLIAESGKRMRFDSLTNSNDLFYGYRDNEIRQLTQNEIKEIHLAPVKGYLYSVTDSAIVVSQSESKGQIQLNLEQHIQVKASRIMYLKIYRKGIVGKRMLNGALIGLSIGFAIGATEFLNQGDSWYFTGYYTIVFSGIGAGGGLVAGTIAGLSAQQKLKVMGNQEVFKSQSDRLKKLSILK